MYKVVSFEPDEEVFCFKIHFKSRALKDCWSYVEGRKTMDLYVLDPADQFCDHPATGSAIWSEGDCVFFEAGNNRNSGSLRRAVA